MRAEAVPSEPTEGVESQNSRANDCGEESGVFPTHKISRILSAVWLTDGTVRSIRLAVWMESVQSDELFTSEVIPECFFERVWFASDDPAQLPLPVVFVRRGEQTLLQFV